MSSKKFHCFFLDACILLPQKNRRFAESCADFLKQDESRCYISSSVKTTILALLNKAYDRIVNEIQRTLLPFMKHENIETITSRDGLTFERFFSEIRLQFRAQGTSYIYFEILGQIEHWLVLQLRTIPRGSSEKPDNFLAVITLRLSTILEKLRFLIDAFEEKEIIVKPRIRSHVALLRIRKMEDMDHLSSAIDYQFSNNVWVVFVTFDEDDILCHKESLFEICALRCSKPMYASDHLRKFSRMDDPVKYYRSIKNHTQPQLAFAKTIKESLSKDITSSSR